MTHWTSIPFYLWKNTFKRWLENPFPVMVKILIPALLAALGVVALAMFAQVERELELQLRRSSALRVHVVEQVGRERAASMTLRNEADELMWAARFGPEKFHFTTQLITTAKIENVRANRSIPVFTKPSPRTMGVGQMDSQVISPIELLDRREPYHDIVNIELGSFRVQAVTRLMPQWLEGLTGSKHALLVTEEMALILKRSGYVHHMLVNLTSIDEVEQFVQEVRAYSKADGRQVTVTSAIEILRELERIQGIQDMVRRLLVAGCCLILAMTLGSIAWLEYRQDSYLLALMRSFGTPVWILFLHALVENLLLVMLGVFSVVKFWQGIYGVIVENIEMIGFEVTGAPNLPNHDLLLIVGGGLAGVLLAMLPVAFGLRKPPGLTLQ